LIIFDESSQKLMEWGAKGSTRWEPAENVPETGPFWFGWPVVCLDCRPPNVAGGLRELKDGESALDGEIKVRMDGKWYVLTSLEKECERIKIKEA
jgi:hypothetical protein